MVSIPTKDRPGGQKRIRIHGITNSKSFVLRITFFFKPYQHYQYIYTFIEELSVFIYLYMYIYIIF